MGGALLSQHHRDTLKFAMKCSYVKIGEEYREVFKDPITDPGKKSKSGKLDLILQNGEYKTVNIPYDQEFHPDSVMRTVFENGKILVDEDFETIRNRCK
jgi:nicotinamide phosphoribosyltransferase